MDRPAPAPPSHRERVFCHQCEHEWYRDEHGLVCPRCRGDFVEVIEAQNDPRAFVPASPFDAPDPDEEDIDQLEWQRNDAADAPPDRFRVRYERTRSQDGQQPQAGGWASFLGNAFRIASDLVQPQAPQTPSHEDQPRSPSLAGQPRSPNQNTFTRQTFTGDGSTTYTRHMHGDGFSFTMTTTRGGLHPRDPMNAQPLQTQPQNFGEIMQLLNNIGAMSPPHSPRAVHPMGPGFMPNPEIGMHPPLAGLMSLLGLPMAAINGDAVYSQEGLDRIISQLMEQHQTGNAPGPATESAIKSLPTREITEKDLGESGTAECSICMESVALGDKVTVLPCEHWFHFDCIEAWLSEHDTCPHCRKGIMADANSTAARSPSQTPMNDTRSPEHNRTSVPGAYPFPEQGSSSRPRGTGQADGVFSRMREAFGGPSNPPH